MMKNNNLKNLIPKNFYDTHIHSAFPKVDPDMNVKKWKTKTMLSGYFFETGLHLNSLNTIYPFENKNLHAFVIPIPYGPFEPLVINESLILNDGKIKNTHLVLLGKVDNDKYSKLEKQVKESKKVIGFKLYQNYDFKYTKSFLKKILNKEILKISENFSLTLFIHANNVTHDTLDFLNKILKKYKNIKIVLTHSALKLTDYDSFDYPDMSFYKKTLLNDKNIEKNKKRINHYKKRAQHIEQIPRLYVNTALISNEILLYPIFKILGPVKRIIYGSDLPFAYATRIATKRKPYSKTSKNIHKFYEGKTPSNEMQKMHYENLLFFLEKLMNVQNFINSKKTKKVFSEILKETPEKFIKR